MGYSLGWVAVRGADRGQVLQALGYVSTGVRERVPESAADGVSLADGWYVVVVHRGEYLLQDALLRGVSAGCEAVACFVEEHVMYSAAVGWRDGKQLWAVGHDGGKDRAHVAVQGDLPPGSTGIRARLETEQTAAGDRAEVDYLFDLPIEVARAATGFRHDQKVPGAEAEPFDVLARAGSSVRRGETRGWWHRLLGR